MSDAFTFHFHIGRSWLGHQLEDECPCGKAPCGLVDSNLIDSDCPQHGMQHAQTMRQMFNAEDCPRCKELREKEE